jgi:hypothetical protein
MANSQTVIIYQSDISVADRSVAVADRDYGYNIFAGMEVGHGNHVTVDTGWTVG